MLVEKLSLKNTEAFNNLLEEAKNENRFRIDFYKYYNNNSIFLKYFLKKAVKLFRIDNLYIGYLWIDVPVISTVTIKDLYIKPRYLKYFDKNLFNILKCKKVFYETYEDVEISEIMDCLHFKKISSTEILCVEIKDIDKKQCFEKDLEFIKYNKGTDANMRCLIQNDVFNNKVRAPLNISDILFDEKQEYFLEDMCFFMKYRKNIIGYGQVIYNRGVFSIVNFGIRYRYRRQGFGEFFLYNIIEIAKKRGIKKLYVRVESNNSVAKNLYYKVGFVKKGIISSWILG